MPQPQKAIIIGNCQSAFMADILLRCPGFTSRFTIERFPPVHVMSGQDVAKLHVSLRGCALLITQPISEEYRNSIGLGIRRLSACLPPDARVITWPSMYCALYNPELFYLKDAKGLSVNEEFDYHHRLFFSGFALGYPCARVLGMLDDPFLPLPVRPVSESLTALAAREKDLDVKISAHIASRHAEQKLFWTFNHPAGPLLLEAAGAVLRLLDCDDTRPAPKEYCDTTIYPILASTRRQLDFHFTDDTRFRIRRQWLDAEAIARRYYAFYERFPQLVEHNRHMALPL